MKILIKSNLLGRYVQVQEDGTWSFVLDKSEATKFASDSFGDRMKLIRALTDRNYDLETIYDSIHYE